MYTTKNRRPVTCKSTRSMLQVMVYSTAFKQKPNNKLKPYTDINKSLLKATCHIVRVRSAREVWAWNGNVDFDAKLHLALRGDLWSNEWGRMGILKGIAWQTLSDCRIRMHRMDVVSGSFSFRRSACEIQQERKSVSRYKKNLYNGSAADEWLNVFLSVWAVKQTSIIKFLKALCLVTHYLMPVMYMNILIIHIICINICVIYIYIYET